MIQLESFNWWTSGKWLAGKIKCWTGTVLKCLKLKLLAEHKTISLFNTWHISNLLSIFLQCCLPACLTPFARSSAFFFTASHTHKCSSSSRQSEKNLNGCKKAFLARTQLYFCCLREKTEWSHLCLVRSSSRLQDFQLLLYCSNEIYLFSLPFKNRLTL